MKKKYLTGLVAFCILGVFTPLYIIIVGIIGGLKFTIPIITSIIVYIWILASTIRIFKFNESNYEVLFPARIFKRKKIIQYTEIEYAEYNLKKLNQEEYCVHLGKYERKRYYWFYSLKYEIACKPKDSRSLLIFLKSKGINIKIYSDKSLKEYEEILKDEEPEKRPSIEFRW